MLPMSSREFKLISAEQARLSRLFETTRVRQTSRRVDVTRSLAPKDFALPASRQFPIHDAEHAAIALLHLVFLGQREEFPEIAMKVLTAVRLRWPSVYRAEAATVKRAKRLHGVP